MLETQKKWYLPAFGVLGWHIGIWNLIGVSILFPFFKGGELTERRELASRSAESSGLRLQIADVCTRARWRRSGARGVF